MRFQIVFAVLATYATSVMADACGDCQRTCPEPTEAMCSKSTSVIDRLTSTDHCNSIDAYCAPICNA